MFGVSCCMTGNNLKTIAGKLDNFCGMLLGAMLLCTTFQSKVVGQAVYEIKLDK